MKSIDQTWFGAVASGTLDTVHRRDVPMSWFLRPHRQPFHLVEPVDALMVDPPTFSLEQDVDPLVAVADTSLGQLSDPSSEYSLQRSVALASVCCTGEPDDRAGSALRHPVAGLQVMHHFTLPGRLQSFFRIRS